MSVAGDEPNSCAPAERNVECYLIARHYPGRNNGALLTVTKIYWRFIISSSFFSFHSIVPLRTKTQDTCYDQKLD